MMPSRDIVAQAMALVEAMRCRGYGAGDTLAVLSAAIQFTLTHCNADRETALECLDHMYEGSRKAMHASFDRMMSSPHEAGHG